MRKIYLLMLPALLSGMTVTARSLSPSEALGRVAGDMQLRQSRGAVAPVMTVGTDGTPALYVFNRPEGGWMIVSADDVAAPVIGFSDSGAIDPENLPENFRGWLEQSSGQIRTASVSGAEAYTGSRTTDREPIAQMVKTAWDQTTPYSDYCPVVNNRRTYTGCVATAMAQVMKYYNWPEQAGANASFSYTWRGGPASTPTLSADFSNFKFDWAHMLDSYRDEYTEVQSDAVSKLMQACGYSVEMMYSTVASAAFNEKVGYGLVTYFNYDAGLHNEPRELYSSDEWEAMVYDNLKNVGPMVYWGSGNVGHCFVCDGYRGDGYFHFNWGWGGVSDGYYLLDTLNPESQGIGGAEGGFNYSQGAVFNMRKPDGNVIPNYDNLKIMGTAVPSLSGRNITFKAENGHGAAGWGNGSWRSVSCEIGAIFEKEDGTVVSETVGSWSAFHSGSISLDVYSYYSTESVNPVITVPDGLADGRYRVVLAARQSGELEDNVPYPWQPVVCNWGDANYCWLTVSGGNLTVQRADIGHLSFSGEGLGSPLYLGRNALLDLKVANDTDIELTTCFYAALYRNGQMQYRGDYMLVSVDAKGTVNKKALASFFQTEGAASTGEGTYRLKLLDAATGSVLADYGDFEMTYVADGFVLTLDDLSIVDAKVKDLTRGSRTFKDAYEISDAADFDIKLDYTVTRGYFDSSIRVMMAQYNPDTNKFASTGENYYYATPFIGAGETENIIIPMNMSSFDVSAVYRITASYMQSGQNKSLGNIYIGFDLSGVDGVVADGIDETAEYFNLQGMPVDNPSKGQIVLRRIGNKTEKIVF